MTAEEMKALGRRVAQAWNEGKPENLDEVYSPDFINHFNGENRERLKQAIQETRAAFSGLHITIDEFIIEGDRSVARWTARSTHTGTYMGIPATGKRVEQVGTTLRAGQTGKSSRSGRWVITSACFGNWAYCHRFGMEQEEIQTSY